MTENNEQLTSYKIEIIAKGIERLESMLDDMKKVHEKEYERIKEQISRVEKDFNVKIKAVETEQENQKLDYTKFKTKVLTWAAAGGAISGIIIQLINN